MTAARRVVTSRPATHTPQPTEPPLPFYLGVTSERSLSWWERRRRERLVRRYLRKRAKR